MTMKTKRPLSINNSLVHGICNCNCQTCGVNKPNYRGPREYQTEDVTRRLISRVEEAGAAGIRVRYIANSGDGEPTLHPDFAARMGLFGRMLREWKAPVPAPEVSVVTNGQRLLEPGVLEAVADNRLTLIVSFPTTEPSDYGLLMFGRPERGSEVLEAVKAGIRRAMELRAEGRIPRLCFHMSPPERELLRRGFASTVEFLTSEAARAGLEAIELVLFPATSNRSGLIRSRGGSVDFYPDLFRAFDRREVNGVRVEMGISYRRFFPRLWEVLDLVRSFSLPCLWNAHLFITAAGDSICCNDQAVRAPRGNVRNDSISGLMARKEAHLPGAICAGCDQRPDRMRGGLAVKVFSLLARTRLALARAFERPGAKTRREQGHEDSHPVVVEGQAGYAFVNRSAALPGAGDGLLTASVEATRSRPALPGTGARRQRLTEVLRTLERHVAAPSADYGFGPAGDYRIRVASDIEDRLKAWRLVYQVYLEKEYATPNAQGLWYGAHDAHPGTTTLLVERTVEGGGWKVEGRGLDRPDQPPPTSTLHPQPSTATIPVATLTLVFDSPLGLPADGVYGPELSRLRAAGRRPCEIVSLVSAEPEPRRGMEIMKHLFKLAYLAARRLTDATDFLITVNPRHVSFYRRILLMNELGSERAYDKVGGAPAVLLHLDLLAAEERYRERYGDGPGSFYRFFVDPETEPETLAMLSASRRPLDEDSLRRFFVMDRPLLAGALAESLS